MDDGKKQQMNSDSRTRRKKHEGHLEAKIKSSCISESLCWHPDKDIHFCLKKAIKRREHFLEQYDSTSFPQTEGGHTFLFKKGD